jgi:hypothetical protein
MNPNPALGFFLLAGRSRVPAPATHHSLESALGLPRDRQLISLR